MKKIIFVLGCLPRLSFAFLETTLPLPEQSISHLSDLFRQGDLSLYFRAREEDVNQALLPHGRATTLSSQLHYHTASFQHFFGAIHFNNVTSYFNSRQNSGDSTTPSKTRFPVIPDPKGTALDEVYVAFKGPYTGVVLGRQKINLDNERFVGTSDFRQMPQTFDAITLVNHTLTNVELFYGFVRQVNTIWQGNQSAISGQRENITHLANISTHLPPFGSIVTYGYFIRDNDIPTNSTQTVGLKYLGNLDFPYLAFNSLMEYAHQNEQSNNPLDFHAYYYHLNAAVTLSPLDYFSLTPKGGWEVLSGNDNTPGKAFHTPLASEHIFNGLADQFTVIPNTGLSDLYFSLQTNVWNCLFTATYHNFRSQAGSLSYGHEIDLSVKLSFFKNYTVGIEFADFSGRIENGFPNVKKIWISFSARLAA